MHKIIIIFLILIPTIYSNDNCNCKCYANDNANDNINNTSIITIINNINIPLLLKLWIITGILINYIQTIVYIMNYH
jgi:hypothetical protein